MMNELIADVKKHPVVWSVNFVVTALCLLFEMDRLSLVSGTCVAILLLAAGRRMAYRYGLIK